MIRMLAQWCGAVLLALAVPGASAQPVSPAEVLLFETDHLAGLHAPAALVYAFHSNGEPAFDDTVQLDLAAKDGGTQASLQFLSGDHRSDVPALDNARGNPVLLGFLEHDLAAMKRLTGGSVSYFRKRIRMALANSAQVSAQPVTWQGRTVPGQLVRIQPYLDDPLHARFERYTQKTYSFVLSDGVPGGIWQLGTSLASPAGGAAVPDATLTLVDATVGPR